MIAWGNDYRKKDSNGLKGKEEGAWSSKCRTLLSDVIWKEKQRINGMNLWKFMIYDFDTVFHYSMLKMFETSGLNLIKSRIRIR